MSIGGLGSRVWDMLGVVAGVLMPDCEGDKEAFLKISPAEAAGLDMTGVKFVDT
jgi:hypothetical protein